MFADAYFTRFYLLALFIVLKLSPTCSQLQTVCYLSNENATKKTTDTT